MGSPCPASEVQLLDPQHEDEVCRAVPGSVAVISPVPQQPGSQEGTEGSCAAPSTCKAVRAYLALTSFRSCSSLWGTTFISIFLSIQDYERSAAPLPVCCT